MIDALSSTIRFWGLSRSSREASSARMVGGIATSDSSPTTFQRRSTRWSMPSSASMPIISSRNSGLPSAAELIRAAAASGSVVVPSMPAIS